MLTNIRSPQHLLDAILVGEVDPEDPAFIPALVAKGFTEGIHLDYKAGDWLGTSKSAKAELRAWVSSFANADGGVLVIGIVGPDAAGQRRNAWDRVACANGNTPLKTWVSTVLQPDTPYYSSPPRVFVSQDGPHELLVIAIRRNPILIPVTRNGVPRFHLRIGDTTYPCPDYLHADLMLGRRERPSLHVEAQGGITWTPQSTDVRVFVHNRGLVHADDVRCGVVRPDLIGQEVYRELRMEVDIQGPDSSHSSLSVSADSRKLSSNIEPFNKAIVEIRPIRAHRGGRLHTWLAALYVVARGLPPQWYQLRLDTSGPSKLSCEPANGTRPVVAWG